MIDWADKLADRIEHWKGVFGAWGIMTATIDFETRSEANLLKVGAWLYSKHPSTETMCLQYHLPFECAHDHVHLWHMAHDQHFISESKPPTELFAFILAGGLVEAHNAFFERCIWLNVMVARHGWPEMPHLQWRCSAAKASAMALPRDLAGAVKAMGLPIEKDMDGRKLMLKLSKPRKPKKAERQYWKEEHGNEPMPTLWHEDEEDLINNWEYCRNDVLAEKGLSVSIPDLSDYELKIWQLDQAMNERGTRFDMDLARAALKMAATWKVKLNDELYGMTGILSGTQRAVVKEWLMEMEGLDLPDTKADTVNWHIDRVEMSGRARRVCEILRDVNKTSVSKYATMLRRGDTDWRIRDLLMYHGATTGRWSGKGVQVHNFPARDLVIKKHEFDEAVADILSGDMDWCYAIYGDVIKFLSHTLRGAIIAAPGKELLVSDYSSIEARILFWLANAEDALKVFEAGGDIYCDMASGIYGYEVIKGVHKAERQFGKQAVLGLGYGMGHVTFLLTCRKYDIYFPRAEVLRIMGEKKLRKYEAKIRKSLMIGEVPPARDDPEAMKKYRSRMRQAAKTRRRLADEREDATAIIHELALMQFTVDTYRKRYPEVKQLWRDLETAAIDATLHPGTRFEAGRTTWFVKGTFLHCELPSGRLISYKDPEIKRVMTSWGEKKPALRYKAPRGPARIFGRVHTYGGKVTENVDQAIARDLMAHAKLLAHEHPLLDLLMSIHDELVCEAERGKMDRDEYTALMLDVQPWAKDIPVDAESEIYTRYRK